MLLSTYEVGGKVAGVTCTATRSLFCQVKPIELCPRVARNVQGIYQRKAEQICKIKIYWELLS